MKKLFALLTALTISIAPAYASDQNDAQPKQLSQEEVANLTLVAESIAHGIGTGLASGIVAGLFIDSYQSSAPMQLRLASSYASICVGDSAFVHVFIQQIQKVYDR